MEVKPTLTDFCRAYGCGPDRAREIARSDTDFGRAVRHFGGMFCHFDPKYGLWRLFGKKTNKKTIIARAQARWHVADILQMERK